MSLNDQPFLFASLDSRAPPTSRKVHIRRLYDVLQLSIQRRDSRRARRTWAILARCKELQWPLLWRTGLYILNESAKLEGTSSRSYQYLRTMMLQHPDEKSSILKELLHCLIEAGNYTEALNELELYLPSFPYHDDPVLHIYAGMILLYLSQPSEGDNTYNRIMLRDSRSRLEYAIKLDPENVVAQTFIKKISALEEGVRLVRNDHDSDEESMDVEDSAQRRKRTKT